MDLHVFAKLSILSIISYFFGRFGIHFLTYFRIFFGYSFMHRFLMIFGSRMVPKMDPKIDPKITQNAHRARLRPGTLLGSILGSFLAPGSVAHGPLLELFCMPKLIKTCPWLQIRLKLWESWKNLPFWRGFGRVGPNLKKSTKTSL